MADQLLKCRRCRWVGIHDELHQVPDLRDSSISHNVCPRCACKNFTPVEEPKND